MHLQHSNSSERGILNESKRGRPGCARCRGLPEGTVALHPQVEPRATRQPGHCPTGSHTASTLLWRALLPTARTHSPSMARPNRARVCTELDRSCTRRIRAGRDNHSTMRSVTTGRAHYEDEHRCLVDALRERGELVALDAPAIRRARRRRKPDRRSPVAV